MTERELDAGARALYADMKIPGRKMPAYDELPAISRGRWRTWAGLVLEAAEQVREDDATEAAA